MRCVQSLRARTSRTRASKKRSSFVAKRLLEVSRPVRAVGVEPSQVLVNALVATGELRDQRIPSLHERLRVRARRIFVERRLHLRKQLLPILLRLGENLR